jgi:acyl-CoA thioester hydrolase
MFFLCFFSFFLKMGVFCCAPGGFFLADPSDTIIYVIASVSPAPLFSLHFMFQSETSVRVRYGETDRMGYVYYGNYATFFEVGRVETIRALGLSYRELEDSGIMLPVADMSVKYLRPAFYDDLLTIKTIIPEMPGTRLKFLYEILNEQDVLLTKGETTLVFVSAETMKPRPAPENFLHKIRPYFP